MELAISMQLFIKILTKISEIQNVVKENKNFLQIIAVLSAYTQKELGSDVTIIKIFQFTKSNKSKKC